MEGRLTTCGSTRRGVSPSGRGAGGQVAPLMALVLVVAAMGCMAVARLGADAADRARARTAADAAALAGASGGRGAATRAATAGDAVVVAYVELDGTVEVTVQVRDHRATSRAGRRPARWGPVGPGAHGVISYTAPDGRRTAAADDG